VPGLKMLKKGDEHKLSRFCGTNLPERGGGTKMGAETSREIREVG